jgi:hypothetical protein
MSSEPDNPETEVGGPHADYVRELASKTGRKWDRILTARSDAIEVRKCILDSLSSELERFYSADTDLVVFGSLARREWTAGSDVDWTVLIDGQATPQHRVLAQQIGRTIPTTEFRGKRLPEPGTTGIFGNMAFSHEIIHHIGGESDSNRNTTQRILLLLESARIRADEDRETIGAHERVVNGILARYLYDDTNFAATGPHESRIPRFLLNDIVRYWRTMCVDFAWKEWEQEGSKWALRNIKLRMSRKLLFVSGLFTVFSCFKNPDLPLDGEVADDHYVREMQRHLMQFVLLTPLDVVAWGFTRVSLEAKAAELFDIYDEFLERINDEGLRRHLRDLPPRTVYQDKAFGELRDMSHALQDVLTYAFFEADTLLREFNVEYGVF